MQFYLRNSRFGTIVHSLLYLFGIPVFFGDYNNLNDSDSREGILRDYGLLVNISNTTTDNLSSLLTGGEKSLDTEKCFEPWGCFKPKFRLFPDTIQDMNPTVCLYTMPKKITSKNGCDSCQIVDNETLRQLQHLERPAAASVINNVSSIRGGQSYWIVHGYMENGNRPWIKVGKHRADNFHFSSGAMFGHQKFWSLPKNRRWHAKSWHRMQRRMFLSWIGRKPLSPPTLKPLQTWSCWLYIQPEL